MLPSLPSPSATKSSELHRDYKRWAEEDGAGFAVSPIAFGRDLSSRGYEKKKVEGQKGFAGLKLKPPEPRTEAERYAVTRLNDPRTLLELP